MTRIRQLYVYGVAAVSLLFLATGLENLVRLLIQTAGGVEATGWLWLNRGNFRDQVSFFVALAVISGPVWAGHWLLANRDLGPAERASGIRRSYLYLVLAGALLFFVPGAIGLARIVVWTLLGAPISEPRASALGAPIGLLAVTFPIYLYHRRLARADASATGDVGQPGQIRRLYTYLTVFIAVNLLIVEEARLATSIWEGLPRLAQADRAGAFNWATLALPSYATAALVLLAVWWWHWRNAEAIAREVGPRGVDERRSLPRRLSLYALILVCVVVCLINATTLLEDLFRALLGAPDPAGNGRPLVFAIGQPLLWGMAYGAFWLYAGWWLGREASRTPEASEQAALRRLYYYLVAAVGLVVFAVGLGTLLDTLLSLPGLAPAQADGWLRDRISLAVTLIVVGGPVWLGHWLHQQRLAAVPGQARAELGSRWRRLYLYAALFVTVVALLVDAASVLYQLLLFALGAQASASSLLELIRTPLSVIVVVGLLLFYHWRVLRADQSSRPEPATGADRVFAAILLRAATPEQLERALSRLAGLAVDGVDHAIAREPGIDRQIKSQLDDWRARSSAGEE